MHALKKWPLSSQLTGQSTSATLRLPLIAHLSSPLHFRVASADPPALHKVVILIEIFKNTCGISAVRDFARFKKFNLHEIVQPQEARVAQAKQVKGKPEDGAEDKDKEDAGDAKEVAKEV
jgi:hypothetical protein